jgi:hypothetical protein
MFVLYDVECTQSSLDCTKIRLSFMPIFGQVQRETHSRIVDLDGGLYAQQEHRVVRRPRHGSDIISMLSSIYRMLEGEAILLYH